MRAAAESPSLWHGGSLGLLARGQVGVGGCKFPCSALGAGDVCLPKAMPRVRTARNFPFLLCLWILTLFHLVIGVLGSPSRCGASMSIGTIQTLCLWEAEGKNSILGSSMAEALHPRAETVCSFQYHEIPFSPAPASSSAALGCLLPLCPHVPVRIWPRVPPWGHFPPKDKASKQVQTDHDVAASPASTPRGCVCSRSPGAIPGAGAVPAPRSIPISSSSPPASAAVASAGAPVSASDLHHAWSLTLQQQPGIWQGVNKEKEIKIIFCFVSVPLPPLCSPLPVSHTDLACHCKRSLRGWVCFDPSATKSSQMPSASPTYKSVMLEQAAEPAAALDFMALC